MPTRNNLNVRVHLQGYKMASAGMRNLQDALNADRDPTIQEAVRKFRDNIIEAVTIPHYTLRRKYCILNWGVPSRLIPEPLQKVGYFLLNNNGTEIASNKQSFFQTYSVLGLLPWYTTSLEEAQLRVNNSTRSPNNPVLVERHVLSGHSGNGIRLVFPGQQVRPAPLYTSYELKRDEYRVHFFKHPGEATQYFVQQKRMRNGADGELGDGVSRFKVRNHANGWVYCNQSVNSNATVNEAASLFASSTTLDFGAIDIIYNSSQRRAYILEVNTAPGIEGSTVTWYINQIKTACKNHNFESTSGKYSA